VDQARRTVRFADAVQTLVELGVGRVVEVGPDGSLAALVSESFGDGAVSVLRRNQDEPRTLINAVAGLHVRGLAVDWRRLFGDGGGRVVDLPTYAFQHERYWLPSSSPALVGKGTDADAAFWDVVERVDVARLEEEFRIDARQSVSEVLPVLARWHRQRRQESRTDSFRYRVSWAPFTDLPELAPAGRWLVVATADYADSDELVGCVKEMVRDTADVVTLSITDDDDRGSVAGRLRAELAEGLAGVVSFLALDERPAVGWAAVPRGFVATVSVAQALGDAGVVAPLWCVTRGAVSTGKSDPVTSPMQALLWGFGRVMAVEHPERWGGLIDLPDTVDERLWTMVGRALAQADGEDQLAVRVSGVYRRRLMRASTGGRRSWRPHGTVLVTGGTGVLGAHVARWLAGSGAEHLVLVGRRGRDAEGSVALEAELVALGARVTIVACDVADRDALADVLAGMPAEDPLTAVVHAAGVLDDALLASLTADQIERTLRAKVVGAVNLHELTRDRELSAFVLFSSVGATFGTFGQGNYAPGNAFLDALAQWRRASGLVATSIAWGSWRGGATTETVEKLLASQGETALEPELALVELGRAVADGEPFELVVDVEWQRFLAATGAARPNPLFTGVSDVQRLLADRAGSGAAAGGDAGSALRQRLSGLSDEEQERVLLDVVRSAVAAALGHTSSSKVGATRAFRDAGFDSVTAVELSNRLNTATGLRLPPTVVFDHPTPIALMTHVKTQLAPDRGDESRSVLTQLDELEASLVRVPADAGVRSAIVTRLRSLASRWDEAPAEATVRSELDAATDEEIFDFIRSEFGKS
jgi:acyl transferase domain-containing protein